MPSAYPNPSVDAALLLAWRRLLGRPTLSERLAAALRADLAAEGVTPPPEPPTSRAHTGSRGRWSRKKNNPTPPLTDARPWAILFPMKTTNAAAEMIRAILETLAEQCERGASRANQDPNAPGTTYNREDFVLLTNLRSVCVNAQRQAKEVIALSK